MTRQAPPTWLEEAAEQAVHERAEQAHHWRHHEHVSPAEDDRNSDWAEGAETRAGDARWG